jgi:hypothetical protein
MASSPQVLGLLEEMLNTEKTPEEVCRDFPPRRTGTSRLRLWRRKTPR